MISRRDRLIGTFIVWFVMFMALALLMQQFTAPEANVWNNWFGFGAISAADPEQASRAFEALNAFSSTTYQSSQALIAEQMQAYLPLLLLLVTALIGAALTSTYIIWRSVMIPNSVEIEIEKRKMLPQSAHEPAPVTDDDLEAEPSLETEIETKTYARNQR